MRIAIQNPIPLKRAKAGRKKWLLVRAGTDCPLPRISWLMALAVHFDGLIRRGIVRDYADLAWLGGVTRARITQIMNLLNLPPWKQEELLFLRGNSRLPEREMRAVCEKTMWMR